MWQEPSLRRQVAGGLYPVDTSAWGAPYSSWTGAWGEPYSSWTGAWGEPYSSWEAGAKVGEGDA